MIHIITALTTARDDDLSVESTAIHTGKLQDTKL